MPNSYFLTALSISSFLIFASGCNKHPTFADLCASNPNICKEFQEDSWCKQERISVGFANLAHTKTSGDIQKFNQLLSYEDYAQCMEHASKIEHIKFKEKQTMRITNVVKAKKKIEEISQATKSSKHPNLLYYHWSRYLDNEALQEFLNLEKTNQLETPELQLNLATYYAKKDPNKTLSLLYHALELTTMDEPINNEVFKSIATLFADKKKHRQVYIWSKILVMHSPEDIGIKSVNLEEYAKSFNLDAEFLDTVASKTLNTILSGNFKTP